MTQRKRPASKTAREDAEFARAVVLEIESDMSVGRRNARYHRGFVKTKGESVCCKAIILTRKRECGFEWAKKTSRGWKRRA